MSKITGILRGTSIVAASLAFATGAMAQAVTLSFATNTPPNNMRGEAEQIFLEELANASNGEITVIPYWGASLLEGAETLGGVRDGVADMGFVNINYYPNQLLLNSAYNLFPKGPSEYENIVWAFDQMYEQIPELDQEFADLGQRIVYKYGVTPYAGTFKSPVEELSDMEGMRVRAASRWYLNLLQGIGATPVSMPWGDLYQALQTGSIDGVFTNIDGIHRASLDEAAPNVYFMPDLWLAIPFIITINENKWQSLSDAQKEAFATAAEAATERFGDVWDSTIERILSEEEAAGITVVTAPPEATETFAALPEVETNQALWADEARSAGAEDPEAILQKFDDIIAEAIDR
ncbi:TRAP-type C4-dicarboxylate transport system substrate-binding protein [Palleronia aestuarii]|uniref:TRAP-type C4-dicarboxylate transport system substrate-binding protein n=1 Tax=Palleronia aestuarii TaxID=568105 RepID=A0A2W7NDQ8_9RHOB|nr:TRAP transporter substrate-binding protein DctP [Palleronia aestuarii]PZX14884.1 TRAP-type C4-dicarboxylate transport system substrate-binding protein [Palleronia aestuarii]